MICETECDNGTDDTDTQSDKYGSKIMGRYRSVVAIFESDARDSQ